jgi:glycopeptide antibiotics resistance protein
MTDLSPQLRLAKLWVSLGWLWISMVIILSLVPPPSMIAEESSLWLLPFNLPYIDKIAHFIAYFILMGWFSQIYHTAYHRRLYLLGFSLLGILLEILQGLGGIRSADWQDVVPNFMGILLAWQLAKTNFAYLLFYLEAKYFLNR